MSDKIDQRIVEMSFENHKFEKGISQSKESLKQFSDTLNNMGADKGFTGLDNTVKGISSSFSALEQIGVGALRRIGEAAVNAGTQMFKSLTIAPIAQGFNEMELKLNSTQTIMASTGETLAVVNQYLQELNEYSDKTIYSFSHMTQNIGKFTNAGVKLEAAVASIKGISNAAALAGANSEEASRAMYNFAQALSAGYVKLVDWKSIELANMATVEFKQQLLESAVAAGTLTKKVDGMYEVLTSDMGGAKMKQTISATKGFNESLSFQWLTTDALTKTLGDYADETTDIGRRATKAATQVTTFTKLMDTLKESVGSGWAQTWEVIFGDFNEAKDLWSSLNDTLGGTINELSDMRNELLSGGLGSGWKQFMKAGISDTTAFSDTLTTVARDAGIDIDKIIQSTGSMEKAVKENWVTGEMLIETVSRMSTSIADLSVEELLNAGYTEKSRKELLALRDALLSGTISAEEFALKMTRMSGRENIIEGLKNSVVALLTVLKPVSKAFDQIFPPKTAENLYNLTEIFKNFTKQLIISDETANKIQRTFAGFFAVVDIGWQVAKTLASAMWEIVGVFMPLNGNLLDMSAAIGDFLVMLNQTIKQSGIFQYALLGVKIVAVTIRDILVSLTSKIGDFVYTLMTTDEPLKFLGETVTKIFSGLIGALQTGITWISGKFMGALKSVQKFFNASFEFNGESSISGILGVLKDFVTFLAGGASDTIMQFGDSLVNLDFSKIATFVTGGILLIFVNQLTNLTKSMSTLLNSTNGFVTKFSKKLFGTQTKIKDLAVSFAILSASLYVLSNIPWENLKDGLVGLAGAMLIFVAAYASVQAITVAASKKMNGAETIKSAFNLTALAGALFIMTMAIERATRIDEDKVYQAVGVVTAMMVLLTAYQALSVKISLIPGQRAAAVKISNMAAGLLGILGVIKLLSMMSVADIVVGMAKVTAILLLLVGIQALFAWTSTFGKAGVNVSFSVFSLAVGLLSLIGVVKLLGILDQREISEGITKILLLGGILVGLQVMFNLAGLINGGVKAKTNILAMQLGLVSMIVLTAILGNMDQQKLQNGIWNLAKMAGIIGALEIFTGLAAKLGGGHKLQKILGSITLTMLSFTLLIGVLGWMKEATIDKGLKTILKMTGIIIAIEVLTALIGRIRYTNKGAAVLVAVIGTILTITASLALLTMIDQDALARATDSLTKAIVAVGIMAFGLGIMVTAFTGLSTGFAGLKSLVKNIIPGFVLLGTMIVAALIFLNMVYYSTTLLEGISWDSLAKFTAGLVAVTGLTIAFGLLSKVPGFNAGQLSALLPAFVAMGTLVLAATAMFALIGTVLNTVNNLSWDGFAKFIIGIGFLGLMATGLAAVSTVFMTLAAGAGLFLGGVLTAIGGVALIIGAFVGLAAVMSLMDKTVLIEGINALVEVGSGIGRFIGAIAGGFSAELLTGYGEGLAGFAAAVSEIDTSSFAGIESLASAILAITGAAVLDGFSRFLNLGKNPGQMFGQQIKSLVGALADISVEDAVNSTIVIRALAPMADALKDLSDAAKDIPNVGGVLGFLAGNNNIDVFGTQIAGFIDSLLIVNTTSATHATDVLNALAPMSKKLKKFADAAGEIPNSGWTAGFLMGNNDLDKFGVKISLFVGSLLPVTTVAAGHATSLLAALTPMSKNLEVFAEAAEKIPNSGGMSGFFSGDNNLDTFGTMIGETVKLFAKLDQGDIDSANGRLYSMSVYMLPGLKNFISLYNSVENFSSGLTFKDIAEDIKDFVKTLKDVDLSIITPALSGLSEINESFKVVGSEIIASAHESFENNKMPFQMAIVLFLDTIIAIINSKQNAIATSFANLFDRAMQPSRSYAEDFKDLGLNIMTGLQNGITSGQTAAVAVTKKMTGAVINAAKNSLEVNSPSKVFDGIGRWLPIGLGHGIERNSKVAILASANMASGVEDAVRNTLEVHSESPKFNNIGEWISTSIGNGINTTKGALMETAKDLGIDTSNMTIEGITETIAGKDGVVTAGIEKFLGLINGDGAVEDIAKELGIESGDAFATGYTDGLTDSAGGSKGTYAKMADDAYQIFKASIDKRREYNLMSAWEEIEAWQAFAKQYNTGTDMRMKVDKEIGRLRFEYSKTWIDKEKYYKRISLEEELVAWENVQARYEKGTEYRLQAEREIFRLKEEIWQAEYEHSLEYIDDEKYYGRMDLTEELKEWKKIYRMTEEGSDERKKADREIFRLENEIRDTNLAYEEELKAIDQDRTDRRKKAEEEYYAKTKEVKDKMDRDIESLNQKYEDAVDSRAKALYASYGLFEKVEKPKYISGFELINNLEDQTIAFDKWQSSLGTLAAKGVDKGLIKELRDMGPKSLAEINALNRLSDTELSRYVDLWQKKSREAKDQAVIELQGMRTETDAEIVKITEAANAELDVYKSIWDATLVSINKDTKLQLDTLSTNWIESIGSMTKTGLEMIKQFKKDWFNELSSAPTTPTVSMAQAANITSIAKPMTGATAVINASSVKGIDAETAGTNIVNGLIKGITKTTPLATDATNTLSNKMSIAFDSFWQINSPSKKTMETGRYIIMGLAAGMKAASGLVSNESRNVGETALSILSSSMSSIPDLLGGDMDGFTITPVLDLTNVRSGMTDVNSMFNNTSGLNLTGSMDLLPKTTPLNQNGILTDIKNGLLSITKPEIDLNGTMTVQIVNDKGEVIAIAEQAVVNMIRRESR